MKKNFYNQKKKNKVSYNYEKRKKKKKSDNEKRKKNEKKMKMKMLKKSMMCLSIREPRKKKTMRRGIGCDIPEDIILCILLRLPVKSLIRFKTVSQTWNALTTDPDFIHRHYSQQPSSKLLLVQWREHYYSTHLYPMPLTFGKRLYAHKNVYKSYKLDGSDVDIKVMGPCFGVFCVEVYDYRISYTLYNFATGATKEVPYIRTKRWCAIGFGCVHHDTISFPEFKIVRLAYLRKKEVRVYTSTTNSWKLVDSACLSSIVEQGAELKVIEQGTEVNGVIHWLAESRTWPRDTNKFILTFDLKKEVFGRIELPHGTDDVVLTKQDDQCLSIIAPSTSCTDIWVMPYGESWVRQAKIGPLSVHSWAVLGYWPSFEGLLFEDSDDEDMGDMGIVMTIGNKHHKCYIHFSETKLFTYVESLVSFNF